MTHRRILTLIATAGAAYLAAMVGLVLGEAPLGSPPFFVATFVAVAAYATILWIAWRERPQARNLFLLAMLFAVAFRVPLATQPVNNDNDMMRYVWDGRLQTLGINPYTVLPADEAVAFAHDDSTRNMPSARHRTPYPPAAQMFFRLVVSLQDSGRAMRLALIVCDLLTILVLWRWLLATGRSEWLVFAYAWSPLVVLEVSHSGHIDALGALWISACAFWLSRRRTALATIAFVLAVTTKLLPIVLLPLLWRRVTLRDGLMGFGLTLLLYAPFWAGQDLLFGVQNVIQHVRFNGPLFRGLSLLSSPAVAARVAVGLGLLVAAWCRWKYPVDQPAAWAWPMAAAILFAPVVYPWYLVYLTPFLLTPRLLPVIAWSCSVLMTYIVWHNVAAGGRWVVPIPVLLVEYLIPVAVAAAMIVLARQRTALAPAEIRGG